MRVENRKIQEKVEMHGLKFEILEFQIAIRYCRIKKINNKRTTMSSLIKKVFTFAVVAMVALSVAVPAGSANAQSAAELQAMINSLLAQIQALQAQLAYSQGGQTGGISGIPAGFTFTKNLQVGMTGTDVMYLQKLLNSDAMTQVAASGAGSPGNETQYFGPATRSGVIKFQNKYASEILAPVGLTAGTGYFGPGTRAKANMLLAAVPVSTPTPVVSPTPTMSPGATPTPTTSPMVSPSAGNSLKVTLASDTPAGASVADAGNANMTKLYLTAGSQEVSVSSLYVTRYGLTSNSDLENIKILDEAGMKVGSIGTLNTNNKAQITFSPALAIAANTTKTYYVRAGIADGTSGGKTVSLGIGAASDIVAGSATVEGSFPVKGNDFTVVALAIGGVDVKEDGAVTDSTPDVGDVDVIVNTFKIVVDSTEAVTVDSITVMESGSASLSDSKNVELYDVTNSVSLGTAQWNADGKAHFAGLNMKLDKGDTRRLRVQLDIIGGTGLQVNADLMDGDDVLMSVKGDTYGFYITPDGNDATFWTDTNNGLGNAEQTINSGAVTVVKSTSTPATGNIAQADDQTVAVFDLVVQGEEVKITSTRISFNLVTMTEGEVTNIKLLDKDGNLIAGPKDMNTTDVTGADSTTFEGSATFTDTIIFPVGTNQIKVVADIATDTSASDTIAASFADADTDLTITGMESNNTITATPGAAEVTGNVQTVKAGDLDLISLAQPPVQSIAKGVSDFVFSLVSLDASASGEDAQVTSLTVSDVTSSGAVPADLDNIEIWADLTAENSSRGDGYETRVAGPDFLDSTTVGGDDTIAFTLTQSITVPKGSAVKLAVIADLASNATGTVGTDTHTITISAATVTGKATGNDIVEDASGSGQAMTIQTSGTLTTSVDSSSPKDMLVTSGSTDVTIAVFRFAADAVESLDLDDIDFRISGAYKISTFKFYKGSGSTPVKSIPGLVGSSTTAQSLNVPFDDNTFIVPASGNEKLTIKADFFSTTNATADNNLDVEVTMLNADTTGKSSGNSGGTLTDATDRVANNHSFFMSYPTVTGNSSSPSGDLQASSSALLAIFDVKAGSNEDVTFQNGDGNTLTISVSQTMTDSDGLLNAYTLKDEDGTTLDTTAAGAAGTEDSSVTVQFDFSTADFTVSAGLARKLYVYSSTMEFEDDGDTIQVWLDDDTATNIDWGINQLGSYNHADKIFKNDIFGGSFVNPS